MKKVLKALLVFAVLFFNIFQGCGQSASPNSIVLMVSDGTGLAHISAVHYGAPDFQFPRFPVIGLFTTQSLDRIITDSAAGATAFAVGMKTNNGMLSMLPDGTSPKTLLERAEEAGMATGLVATSQLTHATPAAFASHVSSRNMEMEIARQMAAREIEVLLGGGQKFFLTNDQGGNLVEQMTGQGYSYLDTREALEAFDTEQNNRVLGLFAESGMPPAVEGRLPLSLMARKAVETLDNDPDGFFMMIEASQVDWQAHDNNEAGVLAEMEDMQNALRWLLDYQADHPDLLVVWVADHETGGVAVNTGNNELELGFATGGHTAQMIPAFAIGPQAERFAGVYDNTDIGKTLQSLLSRD